MLDVGVTGKREGRAIPGFDFHDVKAYAGVEAGLDLRTTRS
jgi:hypothetical protein